MLKETKFSNKINRTFLPTSLTVSKKKVVKADTLCKSDQDTRKSLYLSPFQTDMVLKDGNKVIMDS